MAKSKEVSARLKALAVEQDEWESRNRSILHSKPELFLADWIEITGITPEDHNSDRYGMYRVTADAVCFSGWADDFIKAQPTRSQPEMLRQNSHRLNFPCSPRELIAFVDADDDLSGCLYGSVSEEFREAVSLLPEQYDQQSDASLGAAIREQRKAFASKPRDGREDEYQRWKEAKEKIQQERTRPTSDRELAGLVKERLKLPDSEELIRKRFK